MSSDPIVSVLMTAYNREGYIAEAIASVLSSKLSDLELIVVDDSSSDNTVEVARTFESKDPRVRVFVNECNLGDYANRNRAASYARGKYLKYLDSDDIMYPHCLEVMVTAMESFPDAGYGLSCVPDPSSPYPAYVGPRQTYLEHISGFRHFDRSPGSAIIRRDIFEQTGGFNGRRMIGDIEYWMRLARSYPLVKCTAGLFWTRSHAGRESSSDYASSYAKLRTEVFEEAVSHPACPLSREEREAFRGWLRREARRDSMRRLVSRLMPFR